MTVTLLNLIVRIKNDLCCRRAKLAVFNGSDCDQWSSWFRDLVLKHLSQLELRVNWEKSKLFPVQRISFLSVELDSVSMTASLAEERAQVP